jgi:SAM-dependent methyltransferase
MRLGGRDPFDYLECAGCGGLQIAEIPPDLRKYYPEGSQSPQAGPLQDREIVRDNPVVAFLKRQRAAYCLGHSNPLGWAVSRAFGVPEYYPWLRRGRVELEHEILDVGTGTGRFLTALAREGFRSLTGVEPLIPEDITYPNGIRVLKRELGEVERQFDFILLRHSFERMPDPVGAMWELSRLLRRDRFLFIRLPVAGCYAWRHYRENWVNLDSPRHLWLPTVKGMELLAERVGFTLEHVEFDSTEVQFWASEQYARGTSPEGLFSDQEIAAWRKQAEELNRKGEGDQACFYLYKP